MNHRNRVLLAAVATAIGLGSAAAISLGSAEPVESDPRQGSPLVQIAIAKPARAAERAFTGVISARVQSNLGFRVPGKVIERLVDTGETVRAGQPLMRLDPTDLELALAAREKAVAAARALAVQVAADEARHRKLRKAGWSTQQKYDEVKSALDTANAQLAAAEAEAEVARNEVSYALLLADADGTVVETLAEPGQVVAAGQTVVKLAHVGPREATINLPETVRPAIGSPAQARLYGSSTAAAPARLRQLSDAADPATRTYEARYVLEGEAARAPLGATVTVRLSTSRGGRKPRKSRSARSMTTASRPASWVLDRRTSSVSFRRRAGSPARRGDRVLGAASASASTSWRLARHLLHEGERVRARRNRWMAALQ